MDWIATLVAAPLKTLLFLAGLAFIAVGIARRIRGWINLDKVGRIAAFVIGIALLIGAFAIDESSPPEVGELQTEPLAGLSRENSSRQSKSSLATQANSSQILIFLENTWKQVNPDVFVDHWEDEHNTTKRKRDVFLTTENKLNSIDVTTEKINTTVEQLGGEWRSTAPDTWSGEVVNCFIKIQRQNGGSDYIPCQISGSSGSCDFPWQLDASGRRCGGRAASERSGG